MNDQIAWNPISKIAFRITFIFSLLFIIIKNNYAITIINIVSIPLTRIFQKFVPWFSKNVLHYEYDYSIFTNGSGDTSYDWVSLIIITLLAVIGGIIWSCVDYKRPSYNTAFYWMTVVIRYYLAFMLFNYGAIKLMHAQMPPPSLSRLMQPLHEFSPMGLAWTYLGFSKGFNIFVGLVEIASLLLLFRRTMVIGALITLATSINIMAVNYFFDVPVKILSTSIFIFSIILLSPNINSLFNYFVRGDLSQLKKIERPVFKKKWLNKLINFGKILVLTLFIITQYFYLVGRQKQIAQYFKKSALYGIYKIEKRNSTYTTIPNDWSFIVFEYEGYAMVRNRFYINKNEQVPIDTVKREIRLNSFTLNYTIEANGDILLTKELPQGIETTKLTKLNPEDFELMNAKFKLIQEYPHNR